MTLSSWLRSLGERATPGPWHPEPSFLSGYRRVVAGEDSYYLGIANVSEKNASFIVTSRNLWDELVAVVEAAGIVQEDFQSFSTDETLVAGAQLIALKFRALAESARREGWREESR